MRENRTSGSEGGAAQPNASSLPLSTQIVLHKMLPDILDSNDRYDPALNRLKARSADISIASGVNRWKGSPQSHPAA